MDSQDEGGTTRTKRDPWNKGKLLGRKASAAAEARLVDTNQAPLGRSRPRSCDV